ncbi:hypothetical protein Q5P01_002876 [Channa striata]|uniref:C-type lectin domain-containing protein n=1 Tax=Channa striata TaxID=64152 RepID=A0AA88IQP7_CHASR|nr:hypothetical protein Q5P01_000262 [Channa striata]KAK2863343.1 hypothetical protein Q5P01_002876 [Channa striata]
MFSMKTLTLSALLATVLAGAAADYCLVKRPASCPCGWTQYYGRCFLYVAQPMAWVDAQKHCQSVDANLASIHSKEEHQMIQSVIFTATNVNSEAWIGASDAQQENYWFWIDGTLLDYLNWGAGQPDDKRGQQDCMKMNWGDNNLWDDGNCNVSFPSVCAKNA